MPGRERRRPLWLVAHWGVLWRLLGYPCLRLPWLARGCGQICVPHVLPICAFAGMHNHSVSLETLPLKQGERERQNRPFRDESLSIRDASLSQNNGIPIASFLLWNPNSRHFETPN